MLIPMFHIQARRLCGEHIRHLARAGLVGLVLIGSSSVGIYADTATDSEVLTIVVPPPEKSARKHVYYFPKLLELALAKTEATDGPFEIQTYPRIYTVARLLAKLRRGDDINVIWSMTDGELERTLLRVPVSLLRGLNSHRVFLIRAEDQHRFSAIRSLDELKELRAGSVLDWPDTPVLESHGLQVVTSAHYELLFNMLAGNRVDYFPRGLYEVWQEHELHADKDLAIESSLMFYYPGSIHFFVNRQDKALADRIERGLRIAMNDGSFDKLFFSIPGFRQGYDEMINSERRIYDLSAGHSAAD